MNTCVKITATRTTNSNNLHKLKLASEGMGAEVRHQDSGLKGGTLKKKSDNVFIKVQ